MSSISSEAIISILKSEIKDYELYTRDQEVGTVIWVGDGITTDYGLDHAMYGEIVIFENGVKGMVQDIRQNEIMKVLTIVTTLFMPLTLIAGWYGMNFAHMPELTAPGGYGIICVVCLLLIAVEIWIFKKKGWFK